MTLKVTNMPHDVSTRWNSTFDMLEYALNHRKAVDSVTQDRALGLRKFELDDSEWVLLEQLHDVLKVRASNTLLWLCVKQPYRSSRMPRCTFHAPRQTSLLSFLPWISLMRNLQLTHSIAGTVPQYVLLLVFQSEHSTSTTSLRTIPKCTELPWVSA